MSSPSILNSSESINVLWFKRDLRLSDHEPLAELIEAGKPTALLYIFEPELEEDPHYDDRHWRFIRESLLDMQRRLAAHKQQLSIFVGSAVKALELIHCERPIDTLYSHQETGLAITYRRDLAVKNWCDEHAIRWRESPSGAVQRGIGNRKGWDRAWHATMSA